MYSFNKPWFALKIVFSNNKFKLLCEQCYDPSLDKKGLPRDVQDVGDVARPGRLRRP